jgi:hypothetical protein
MLARIRWNNVALALVVVGILALVAGWPALEPQPVELPPAGVPAVAATPRPAIAGPPRQRAKQWERSDRETARPRRRKPSPKPHNARSHRRGARPAERARQEVRAAPAARRTARSVRPAATPAATAAPAATAPPPAPAATAPSPAPVSAPPPAPSSPPRREFRGFER